jgi:hypothetical protein
MSSDHNDPTTTDEQVSTDIDPTTSTDEDADKNGFLSGDIERRLRYAVVAGLALLALIATLRFYFAAGATIDTWVAREYRSLFQALFNLTILLVSGAGILWQVQKLR